jgi:hypothetical protein
MAISIRCTSSLVTAGYLRLVSNDEITITTRTAKITQARGFAKFKLQPKLLGTNSLGLVSNDQTKNTTRAAKITQAQRFAKFNSQPQPNLLGTNTAGFLRFT